MKPTQKIILIVTGSIAAVKIFDQIQLLKSANFAIKIILTTAALQWISTDALELVCENAVYLASELQDINNLLATTPILVTAASADFIKQLVYQDSALAKAIRAQPRLLMLAPAMNVMMWQHPAVQRNIKKLIKEGCYLLGPITGNMACGDHGYGRLLEPNLIIDDVIHLMSAEIIPAHIHNRKYNAALVTNPALPKPHIVKNKKILLMIQGGRDMLNCYSLISCLQSGGWNVTCVVSEQAQHYLPSKGLATLSNNKVYHSHYQEDVQGMEHIRLSEMTDILLIAPATRHAVLEMVRGGANNFMGCVYLATKKPVLLLPSLDQDQTPQREDLIILEQDGVTLLNLDHAVELSSQSRNQKILKYLNDMIDHVAQGKNVGLIN